MTKKKTQSEHNQSHAQERTVFDLEDGDSEKLIRAVQKNKALQNMTQEELIRFIHNFNTLYINEEQSGS